MSRIKKTGVRTIPDSGARCDGKAILSTDFRHIHRDHQFRLLLPEMGKSASRNRIHDGPAAKNGSVTQFNLYAKRVSVGKILQMLLIRENSHRLIKSSPLQMIAN